MIMENKMSHKIDYAKLESFLNGRDECLPFKINVNSFDDFLKIRETLTRIGRLNKDQKSDKDILWQTCHVVQDELSGDCYLVHFKHLYMLNGKEATTEMVEQDIVQLEYVASLLEKWGFVTLEENLGEVTQRGNISVIPHSRKKDVILKKKFYIKKETV